MKLDHDITIRHRAFEMSADIPTSEFDLFRLKSVLNRSGIRVQANVNLGELHILAILEGLVISQVAIELSGPADMKEDFNRD